MQQAPRSGKAVIILYLILWGLLIGGAVVFLPQFRSLDLFRFEDPEQELFGGTDWVRWENRDDRIVAVAVHPLRRNHEGLSGDYIRTGDVLKKVDYREVYKAQTVREITAHAPPGKVLIYTIERLNEATSLPETQSLFVVNSYRPTIAFLGTPLLWTLLTWVAAIGAFLALVSLLILFPILRSHLAENMAKLLVIGLSLLIFLTLFTHQLYLFGEPDFTYTGFEKVFYLCFAAGLVLYGVVHLFSQVAGPLKWLAGVSALFGAALIFMVHKALYSGDFYLYTELLTEALLLFFLVHVFISLIDSLLQAWKTRSTLDRLFHIVSLLLGLGLMVVYARALVWPESGAPDEKAMFLVLLLLFTPLLNVAAGELKFGKVSVVLTRTILYLFFSIGTLFLYFVIHQILTYAGIVFKYQNLLEISILILLFLTLRRVYVQNENRFRKYFILSQQKREDQLNAFISTIPQHTSSEKLLEGLERELKAYFETDGVWLWMNGSALPGPLSKLGEADLNEILAQLREQSSFWARNRVLSTLDLPKELDDILQASGLHQLHLVHVKVGLFGMILLGKKKRGVYNLSDVDLLSRIIQQTRLTLDVLDLVEREKLLMKQTYEANLTALRSQINPHFLFNTLNTISALIHDDPDDAEEAIEKLAFIFRYTLKKSSENFVTIRDEHSLISTYLDIEQIRFGARLEVNYKIDDHILETKIPAFVIQTIVENSIKHGIAKIIEKGVVSISYLDAGEFVECIIEDNGPGIDHSKIKTSTGLNNTLTRLEEIYHIKNLLYFENTGNGTKVTLKIPTKTHE